MNYECYIMIKLTFLKKLILVQQVNQKSVIFPFIVIFKKKGLSFNRMSLIGVMMYNFRDIAILNIHGANYSCIISGISKCEAINLMQNVDLSKKSGTL